MVHFEMNIKNAFLFFFAELLVISSIRPSLVVELGMLWVAEKLPDLISVILVAFDDVDWLIFAHLLNRDWAIRLPHNQNHDLGFGLYDERILESHF